MPANTTYLGTGGGPNAGEGQTAPLSIVTLTNATGFVQGKKSAGLTTSWSAAGRSRSSSSRHSGHTAVWRS